MSGKRKDEISLDALMGVRYLAAVTVILAHADLIAFTSAVPFFFVLSGFILTYKYAREGASEREPASLTVDVRTFWIARFSRIYPCHALALAMLVAWRLTLHDDFTRSLGGLTATLLMVQSWCPSLVAGWNTPSWTNSCEAFFYLVFPLLVASSIRLRTRGEIVFVMLVWYLAGLALTSVAVRHADTVVPAIDGLTLFVKYSPIAHLPEFACGVLLGRLFRQARPAPNPRLGGWLSFLALVAAIWLTLYVPSIPRAYVHNTLLVPLFAMLTWALALGGGLAPLLSLPLMVRLGHASYAFYILQDPIGLPFYNAIGQTGAHTLAGVIAFTILLTLSSVVVYEWFEEPLMHRLRRWLGRRLGHTETRPLRAGGWESLAGLAIMALVIGEVQLLPQRNGGVEVTLDRTLAAAGATRIGWDGRGDPEYLRAYADRLRHSTFVPLERNAPYVITVGPWPQGKARGARQIGAESNGLRLWAMPGAFLPPYMRVRLDQPFGMRPDPAIEEEGFYEVEHLEDGTPFRWTAERAELRLMVPPRPPRHLLVRVGRTRETDLEIAVDDVVAARRHLPPSQETSFVVSLPPVADRMCLRLTSKGFVPGGGDERLLGVPLFEMKLLP